MAFYYNNKLDFAAEKFHWTQEIECARQMDLALARAFESGKVKCAHCKTPTTEPCTCFDPCEGCGQPNWECHEDHYDEGSEWAEYASYKHIGCPKYWA